MLFIDSFLYTKVIENVWRREYEEEKKEVASLGIDSKVYDITATPRLIVTTDGEVDDQNSMRHLLLYANDIDIDGIVYSASQFHWQGDGGKTTLGEVTKNNMNAEDNGEELTEYRPQEMGRIQYSSQSIALNC